MNDDYSKRDYLLPEGCKDLIDVLKPKVQHSEQQAPEVRTEALPPIVGEITVAGPTTVVELAERLRVKPFKIIADLMQFGVFATPRQPIRFETIAQVARKYGYVAKLAE
jgi:hypothetical protein